MLKSGQMVPFTFGSEYFPAVNLTVFTSEGSITFPVPSEARVGETWASDVEAKLKKYDALLSAHHRIMTELKDKKASEVRVVGAEGKTEQLAPGERIECPLGQFMTAYGVTNPGGFTRFPNYIRCGRLEVERK